MSRMDRRDAQRARRRRTALAVLAAALALLLLYSLYRVGTILWTYGQGEAQYDQVARSVATALPTPTAAPDASATAAETAPAASPAAQPERIAVDFSALQAINPDACAWLYGQGASLHYPVVQGEDNEYYLSRLFDGSSNAAGCPFLDSRCEADLSSKNSVVYGHNMKDGSMFAALEGYKEQDFFEAHPYLLLLTPGGDYEARVFSACVVPTDAAAWQRDFPGEDGFAAWLGEVCAASCIDTGLVPGADERVLTLSTCSYEFADARLVVHCVLREV